MQIRWLLTLSLPSLRLCCVDSDPYCYLLVNADDEVGVLLEHLAAATILEHRRLFFGSCIISS
jgi:hypothetical protein